MQAREGRILAGKLTSTRSLGADYILFDYTFLHSIIYCCEA